MKLHWQIIIGLVAGVLFGVLAAANSWSGFTQDWIAPFGTIFVNLLKLIAVPLVFASLVTGVASLADVSKLSRMGMKTLALYVITTTVSISIGLILVNLLQPGKSIPAEVSADLQASYQAQVDARSSTVEEVKARGPLQPVVDIVPKNIFSAAADNKLMLQVVFFSLLFGVGLSLVRTEKTAAVLTLVQGLNDIIVKIVDLIMLTAPVGVFALMAGTITAVAGDNLQTVLDLLRSLGFYSLVVILGLAVHITVIYGPWIHFFSRVSLKQFFSGIAPAQLLAFSTSSSGATLPVTLECVEKNLGVKNEVAAFVLPLGATINLDGTALYQGVAAVFIAQALGIDLNFAAQLTILLTALLASIAAAPVPGAGFVMLVIVLEAVGIPSAGLALILGVDRILDMFRTATNVTGDTMVALMVDASEERAKAKG
jgi:Na+/H+-dicarboxylate symporter